MQCEIKRATPADVDALLALMHDFYAEAGFTLDRRSIAAALQSLLANPTLGCIWVAHSGNRGIGHTVLTVRFTMEHEGLSGYVDDLYVQPQFRRMGVAQGLLTELIGECRTRGCKALQVEVGQSNDAALALYAKFGLRPATDDRVLACSTVFP